MFEDMIGAYGSRLVVAVLGVGAAFLCLIGILWIVRGRRGPSPFVRGGRNRNPRLQVLDAAAVDTRRRLVLVRRDDVEHLIMIGGPTDIVVESRISHPNPPKGADGRPPEVAQATIAGAPAPTATPEKSITAPPTRPSASAAALETAAIPQQRQELPREPHQEQPLRETRPAQPTSGSAANAAPTSAVSVNAPIATPRVTPVTPEILRPTQVPPANGAAAATVVPLQQAPEVAGASHAPGIDDAAKLLDSARDRVFVERPNQSPAPTPAVRPAPPVGQHPTALGSDFEKILEEEMASNLAARDAALAGRGSRPIAKNIPAAGPSVPVPGASRQDPPLQAEVARIFGEMSASRDK